MLLLQPKYIYWPLKKKKNLFINNFFLYNSFQLNFLWIKKSFKNNFYLKFIKKINFSIRWFFKNFKFLKTYYSLKKLKFFNFFFMYRFFFFNYLLDLNYFLLLKKKKYQKFFFFLYWVFKDNQRVYFNFQNFKKLNFLFLSNGLFLKYFEKKKSFKKNKAIKLLLARYLRKLFLLINFKNNIFIFKKTPSFIIEMMNILNMPIIHKFVNPFSNKIIEENKLKKNIFNISYFIFFKNIDFSKNKIRKKGRIKRKITRKITLSSSIID